MPPPPISPVPPEERPACLRPASVGELAQSLARLHHQHAPLAAVDLGALVRVLDHTPEDMTVTVEAGLTLATLQEALARRGQWLPIDPPHADRLTVAGLLDHNLSGPRRGGHGTIRDHLLGLRVVLADGRIIFSGGKVVKSVAGYDLLKLFVGGQRTLGVIVEATFKLLPLPEAESIVQASCASLDESGALLDRVLDSELTPTILDLHHAPRTAHHVVLGFSGPHEDVAWQLARARALGFTAAASLDYEAAFHVPETAPIHRLSVLPSRLVAALKELGPEASWVARAGNGVIHYRGATPPPKPEWPPTLIRRVKDAYDPHHVFPELTW